MIFLTIGTHEPFDRLVKAVDDWIGQTPQQPHEIVAQVVSPPSGGYKPRHFDMIPYLAPAEYANQMRAADLIVSHAGMGSLLTAFTYGKPIVIMPRRGHLRETRNDHQYATVKNLGAKPGLFVAQDETEFSAVMNKAVANISGDKPPHIADVADPAFTDALRSFILASGRE